MARQKAKIVQIKGSAFVGVVNPNTHMLDTPIEQQYSDWGNIASEIASDAFVPIPEPLTPEPHETTPSVSLTELLAEVDAILYPAPRVNTSPEIVGYHYTGHPTRKETNWQSPAVKAWQAHQQRKSDLKWHIARRAAEVQHVRRIGICYRRTHQRHPHHTKTVDGFWLGL